MDRNKLYGSEHTPLQDELRKQAILRRVKMRRETIRGKNFEAVRECEAALRFLTLGARANAKFFSPSKK